jgi:glycosyltransferase involved in cell wall biosynthesis
MKSPRVTVGYTTYNVERFLPQSFDAIRAQDFDDFEVVVCDNGSTDATLDICDAYALEDKRFRIYRNPANLGVSGSYRRAVELARGEFFRLTMHDDLCGPTLLSSCVQALDTAGPAAVLAYPLMQYIDESGNKLGVWDDKVGVRQPAAWRRVAQYAGHWNHGAEVCGVIRLDALRRTSLMLPVLSSDIVMMAQLAALGQFLTVPERLFLCRHHANSTYQGNRTPEQVLAILEPAAIAPRRKMRSHHDGIDRIIGSAIMRMDLPLATRASASVGYRIGWTVRRSRVRFGALRRRIRGRPVEAAPWAAPAADTPQPDRS